MKILHYVDENRLAWGEAWIQLIKELERQGMDNRVVCKSGGTLSARLAEEGIAFDTAGSRAMRILRDLGRVAVEFKPDIIHTRLSSAAMLGGCIGKKTGIPVVQSVDKFPKAKYHRNADFLLPCSVEVKEHMLSLGFPESKMQVIFNPLEISRYTPDPLLRARKRTELGIGGGQVLITAAGRFVDWKGFDILLRAYAAYLAEDISARSATRLLLAGDGEEKAELLKLAEELKLGENLILPGFVSDIRPYLQASDIFVLPSKTPEPFGVVLLEAMASGVAPIATRGGGALDMIREDESGWFAEMGDAGSLREALARAVRNGEERERVALAALKQSALFDVQAIAGQVISVYREIKERGASESPRPYRNLPAFLVYAREMLF